MIRPARHLAALAVALVPHLLGGCGESSAPPNRPSPEGQLTVMGGAPAFSLDAPPQDWIVSTDNSAGRAALSAVTVEGTSALEIQSGPQVSVAVRKVDAWLLATPYLGWRWHLSDHGQGVHPVRIVVGFLGGADQDGAGATLGGGLPPHDRALALVWGDSALKRGHLTLPPPERRLEAPIYTVRGGRENTRKWWREDVDLSDLYARAWPADDPRRVRVTFIGIAAAPREPTVRGRVSGIELTH